jgi:hypothetical protein
VGQLQVGKNVSTEAEDNVGIRHWAMTGEDTADWEALVRAEVNSGMCELATALQLHVVTICKCSINPITDTNPVYSHTPYA